MAQVAFSVTLEYQTCCVCGTPFGIESTLNDNLLRKRLASGKSRNFYCPNGHSQVYSGKTDAQKQRERAERAEAVAEQNRRLYESEQANARKLQAKADRLKKRASGGVCPCCNRTFISLGRHMTTKHPEYK